MDPLFKETLGKAFSLFLGLAALALTGWGCFGLVANVTWILTTVGIEGKVLAYDRAREPQTWNPVIEFTPPGGTRIKFVSELVITTPDPARGSMVPVRYFQRNPQDAELALFRFKWAHPVVYTSAGLAVFLVWWRTLRSRPGPAGRKRRPEPRAAPPRARPGAEDGSNAWERTAIKGSAEAPEEGSDAWDRTNVLPGRPPPRKG